MELSVDTHINATPDKVWAIITNIDGAVDTIVGIVDVKVLERPSNGLVGLKWEETRVMFGREATETMWITDAVENQYYQTRAENHGAIYISRMSIEPKGDGTRLEMSFGAEVTSTFGRIMNKLMGWMMVGSMRKMIAQDLADIKAKAES